jgi:hypothetical protein
VTVPTDTLKSYCITLQCRCVVYVSRHPVSGFAHTRIIQSRGSGCHIRHHEVGRRLYLWELLPDSTYRTSPEWVDELDSLDPQ